MSEAKIDIERFYNGTHSDDGIEYAVLDSTSLFQSKASYIEYVSAAVRTEPVYIWHPETGTKIDLYTGQPVISEGNETVFIKKLDQDGARLKVYIPSGADGPLGESVLNQKYEKGTSCSSGDEVSAPVLEYVTSKCEDSAPSLQIKRPKPDLVVEILYKVIDRPSIILNARGEGVHQKMQIGDSLKFEDGECLPLPGEELEVAWKVSERGKQGGMYF